MSTETKFHRTPSSSLGDDLCRWTGRVMGTHNLRITHIHLRNLYTERVKASTLMNTVQTKTTQNILQINLIP
jgi:hypothetical protein